VSPSPLLVDEITARVAYDMVVADDLLTGLGMSDLVPPEKPTGEIAPLRPKSESKKGLVNPGLKPPWQVGESGNPSGRPRGSRSRLSESFLSDFHLIWEEEGLEAIRRVARNDPSTFVRVAASLLPHDINLNVGVNAETFVANFRQAVSLLGNEPPPPRQSMKMINADDDDHH
jgi:hypothetical protein